MVVKEKLVGASNGFPITRRPAHHRSPVWLCLNDCSGAIFRLSPLKYAYWLPLPLLVDDSRAVKRCVAASAACDPGKRATKALRVAIATSFCCNSNWQFAVASMASEIRLCSGKSCSIVEKVVKAPA